MNRSFSPIRNNEMVSISDNLEFKEMRDDEMLQGYVSIVHKEVPLDPLIMIIYTWEQETSEYDIQVARQDALSSLELEFNKWIDRTVN